MIKEKESLQTLWDLYVYLGEENLSKEERQARLAVAEEHREAFFEKEKKTNQYVGWHQELLTCLRYYYYIQFEMHEWIKADQLIERIETDGYDSKNPFDRVLTNKLISLYQQGEKERVFQVLRKIEPASFMKKLRRHQMTYVPAYSLTDFLSMMLDFIESIEDKEARDIWIDESVHLLTNAYYIDWFENHFHTEAEDVYPYFNEFLKMTTEDVIRTHFISSLRHQAGRIIGIDPEDASITFKTAINKLNLTLYEEHHKIIDHYISLYRDTFPRAFVRITCTWHASFSFARWKEDLLKRLLFQADDMLLTLSSLYKHEEKRYKGGSWTLEFLEEKKEKVWEQLLFRYANEHIIEAEKGEFHRLVTDIYMTYKKYQQAVDYLYSLDEQDEDIYELITNVYCQVGQYEDILNILTHAQKDKDLDLEFLIDEVKEKWEGIQKKEKEKQEKERQVREKEEAERPPKMRNAYFNLESLVRKIVIITYELLKTNERVSTDQLLSVLKWNDTQLSFLMKKVNKLIQEEMIVWDGEYIVDMDQTIRGLASNMVDPKLEAQIIKADDTKRYKQVFFHESEMDLYRILCEMFPQSYVFPNMSLQTIIDYEKLKLVVDSDTFEYYLKTHVDYAIVNSSNYFPMIAIEKDSDYNDIPDAKRKGEMKNLIFQLAGIPLIRVRYTKAMNYENLKRDLIQATKPFLLEHKDKDDHFSKTLIDSIDLKRFDIVEEVDINTVKRIITQLIGESLMEKVKSIELKDNELFLTIAKELFILQHSHAHITKQVQEEFPSIEQVHFQWY